MTARWVMPGLLALGPEGPFPASSQATWVGHRDGLVRSLSPARYADDMVLGGLDPERAAAFAAGIERHGGEGVLVAAGQGGRPGHANATWDVRVVATASPFAELAGDLPQTGAPAGSAPIGAIDGLPEVIESYGAPLVPQRFVVPDEIKPAWARWLRLKMHIEFRHEHEAVAELGVARTLVGIRTTARSKLAAEDALIRLVGIIAYDLTRTVTTPTS